MWHYALGELKEGPFGEPEMVELIENGNVLGETLVWREGMDGWRPLSLTALARHLGPGYAVPAAKNPNKRGAPVDNRTWPYRPTNGFAMIVSVLLLLSTGVSIYLSYLLIDIGSGWVTQSEADLLMILGLVTIGLSLILAVFWCIWTVRSAQNVRAFGARGLRFSPGWAAGWYFVPFMNLFKPYQAMLEIWRATINPQNPDAAKPSRIVDAWWFLWLISNVMTNVAMRLSTTELAILLPISSGLTVLSVLAALYMVWGLTLRQKEMGEVLARARFDQELNS